MAMNADQQRTIDRVQKLFALARNNPNSEEAMSARLKARQMLLTNGLDPDMFNEDMTSTMQMYDAATAKKNTFSYEAAQNRDNAQQQANCNYNQQTFRDNYQDNCRYSEQQAQPRAAAQPSVAARIYTLIEPLLFWLLGLGFVFMLIGTIWPWSAKSLFMTLALVFLLANLKYLLGIGVLLAIGSFIEAMIH